MSALRHLEEARRAEFGDQDPRRALAAAEAAVGAMEEGGNEASTWLMLQAAWVAQRAGSPERVDHWRQRLEAAGWSEDFAQPAVVAGVLMLDLTRGRLLSDRSRAAFGRLPPDTALLALAEMADRLGESSAVIADLRRQLATIVAWRATLRKVERAHLDWTTLEKPLARRIDDRLLLYWPREGGGGTGVLVPPDLLAETLRRATPGEREGRTADGATNDPLSPVPWEGRIVAGFEPPPGAVPVVTGISVLPLERDAPLPIWARPGAAAAILLALAILLGLGLWLSDRALRREAQAARARADFLTSITHELRTPLASIRLFAEMLAEGRTSSEAQRREYLELLGGEAAQLSALVENVLDLGRAARGERGYDRRQQPIGPCLEHIVSVFSPLARRDGLELAAQLSDPETRVRVDREALTQAVLNVLDNARRYGAGGGRIVLRGCRIDDRYRIEIRDDGPGVSFEERETIFEPFTRGAGNASGTVPGLGVGLSLSRTILRAHAGDLVLEERSDHGACFVATLPVAEEDEEVSP